MVGLCSPEISFSDAAICVGKGASGWRMTYNNYTIHHVDLSGDIPPLKNIGGEAHYLVYWYGTIPLGQCFLTRQQVSDPAVFVAETFRAIAHTLAHYNSAHHSVPSFDPFVEPQKFSGIISLCEQIMGPYDRLEALSGSDISVIVCTRNRPGSLKNCLDALRLQRCKPLEIIVVDNAPSNEETREVAEGIADVRYIRENRIGLDIARNTGLRSARGSIVAFTDDDTLPDLNWVYRIAQSFHKRDVVAMTGLVIAGSLQNEAEIIFEKFWPFNRGYIPRLYDKKFFNATLADGPPVWQIGAGANMAFRKSVFDDVGYFDERLDAGAAGCSGDSELWYRILANGFRIIYNPLAVVKHFHRSSVGALKGQLYAYMKGFTVAMLIQHQRFGHKGNLQHLFRVIPLYYLKLITKGFPSYGSQYQTLFDEMRGILSGMIYYLRHRNTNAGIYYGHDHF
jgi:GT2 family glycosyltransferase